MTQTVRTSHTPLLDPIVEETTSLDGRYKVVIFNNDHTPMDTVVQVLMEATGCDIQEAYFEMWEAHHFGQAPVHFAGEPVCQGIAATISAVGVKTEVTKEWDA